MIQSTSIHWEVHANAHINVLREATMSEASTSKGFFKPTRVTLAASPKEQELSIFDEELLTDQEIMDLLKVKKQWLRDHTTRVEPILPHLKIGREIRYLRSDVIGWCQKLRETRPSWERKEKAA